jgi:hypothetical protein
MARAYVSSRYIELILPAGPAVYTDANTVTLKFTVDYYEWRNYTPAPNAYAREISNTSYMGDTIHTPVSDPPSGAYSILYILRCEVSRTIEVGDLITVFTRGNADNFLGVIGLVFSGGPYTFDKATANTVITDPPSPFALQCPAFTPANANSIILHSAALTSWNGNPLTLTALDGGTMTSKEEEDSYPIVLAGTRKIISSIASQAPGIQESGAGADGIPVWDLLGVAFSASSPAFVVEAGHDSLWDVSFGNTADIVAFHPSQPILPGQTLFLLVESDSGFSVSAFDTSSDFWLDNSTNSGIVNNAGGTISYTVGFGARVLTVGIVVRGSQTIDTITYNGVAMTLGEVYGKTTDYERTAIYYMLDPPAGTHSLVYALSAAVENGVEIASFHARGPVAFDTAVHNAHVDGIASQPNVSFSTTNGGLAVILTSDENNASPPLTGLYEGPSLAKIGTGSFGLGFGYVTDPYLLSPQVAVWARNGGTQDLTWAAVGVTFKLVAPAVPTDAATVNLALTPSSTDVLAAIDSSTGALILTPSVAEAAIFADQSTAAIAFTPSTAEVAVFADTGIAPIILTPSTVEVIEVTDAATTVISLTPSTIQEGTERSDSNTVVLTVAPFTPYYLVFNGAGDYVEIPDNAAYSQPTTGGITISLWIRPDVLDFSDTTPSADGPYINFCTKMTYVGGAKIEWLFRMYNLTGGTRPNRISFYVFNASGGVGVGSYFQEAVIAGEWIHVVGTIDATSTHIFKNGANKDNDVYTATITPTDTTAPVRLGWGEDPTDGSYFQGGMNDLMIFSRALSSAEVASLYDGVIPSGLVGRWRLDDGSGNTATDDIAANNGTLHPGSGRPQWVVGPILPEFIEHTDANTAILTITPSGVEVYTGIGLVDANTERLALTPSTVEVVELVDTNTVTITFTPSYAEAAVFVDTNTTAIVLTPSTVEIAVFIDTNTAIVALTPSAAEIAESVESSTASVVFTPSGTEALVPTISDAATVPIAFTPASADIAIYSDSATEFLLFTVSGTDDYLPPNVITDSNMARISLTSSAIEITVAVDAATEYLGLAPSAIEFASIGDSASQYLKFGVSGSDVLVPGIIITDSATEYLSLIPSAVEIYVPPAVYTDAATIPLNLIPASTDIMVASDTVTARVDLVPSAVELYLPPGVTADQATVPIVFTPASTEAFLGIDAVVSLIVLTPSGVEILVPPTVITDADIVYIRLTVSGFDFYVPAAIPPSPPKLEGEAYKKYIIECEVVYEGIAYKLYTADCTGSVYMAVIPYRRWWTRYDSTYSGNHRASAG